MKNYRTTVAVNDVVVHTEESKYPSFTFAATRALHHSGLTLDALREGQSVSIGCRFAVTIECLTNRRAPRRPPEVIAQEKAARLAAAQERAQEQAKYAQQQKEERAKRCRLVRQRITNQIDHAFATGARSGAEPVAKYVTCMNCDAPAAFLYLNLPVPSGAAVLEESTIVGAVCTEHSNRYNATGVAEVIPCSRLEFFYENIRQIAIKAEK